LSGGGGIRTLDPPKTDNGFRDRRIRPLCHPSRMRPECRASGEGGIRTLEGGLYPLNALAGRCLQPLGHFSGRAQGIRWFGANSPNGGITGCWLASKNGDAGFPLILPALRPLCGMCRGALFCPGLPPASRSAEGEASREPWRSGPLDGSLASGSGFSPSALRSPRRAGTAPCLRARRPRRSGPSRRRFRFGSVRPR
jgi:hypothetical protein